MNQRITIKDIAEKAKVSTGTVDRVIHNRGNVAPKVKARVLEVMEELGYKRNIIASTLAYNRLFRIAAILPDYKQDPYWEQPKKGIDKAVEIVQHYRVVVKSYYFDLFKPSTFLQKCNEMWEDEEAPDAVLIVPQFLKESKVFQFFPMTAFNWSRDIFLAFLTANSEAVTRGVAFTPGTKAKAFFSF